jgi:hypothetical protein
MDRSTLKRLSPNVNSAVWTEIVKHLDTLLEEYSVQLYKAEGNQIYKLQGSCDTIRKLQSLQRDVNAKIQDERNGLND